MLRNRKSGCAWQSWIGKAPKTTFVIFLTLTKRLTILGIHRTWRNWLPLLPPLHTVSVSARKWACKALGVVVINTLFSTGGEAIFTRLLTSGSSPMATMNKSEGLDLICSAASWAATGSKNFPSVMRTTVWGEISFYQGFFANLVCKWQLIAIS